MFSMQNSPGIHVLPILDAALEATFATIALVIYKIRGQIMIDPKMLDYHPYRLNVGP